MSNSNDEFSIIDYEDTKDETIDYVTGVKSCTTIDTNIMALILSWQTGDLRIPKFQRRFVWTIEQASRFIDSLISELPIPSIIIYKDNKGYQYIIDGQQRIKSILYFMGELGVDSIHNDDKKFINFRLKGLSPTSPYYEKRYSGKGADCFTEEQQRLLRNRNIPVTTFVLNNPDKDMELIYSAFRRLNTGGTPLTEQEIRFCVYSGIFNDFLYDLNENEIWQGFFTNARDHIRQKDAELILRFFALQESLLTYKKPMKDFLSIYFKSKKNCSKEELKFKERIFIDTITAIHDNLGKNPFHIKSGINSSAVDSIMVAFSRNLDNIPSNIFERYHDLLDNKEYDKCISKSSNDVKSVQQRIDIAEEILFKNATSIDTKIIKLFDFRVSAGLGNWLDDDNIPFQEIAVTNRRADFALRITGDSMEPKINDGDIILVQKNSEIRTKNIGVFTYRNETYCKIYVKSNAIYLSSANKKYKTIRIEDQTQFHIHGIVVEVLPKESFTI